MDINPRKSCLIMHAAFRAIFTDNEFDATMSANSRHDVRDNRYDIFIYIAAGIDTK